MSSDGAFTVASARQFIDDYMLGGSSDATRWVSLVSIKVNIFSWKLMVGGLPTRWKMLQRGMELESLLCLVCGDKVEDVDHLLFSCSFAEAVMDKVMRWWGLTPQVFYSLLEWKTWFEGLQIRKKIKEVLEGTFFVTWWAIWNFRNKLLFGTCLPSKSLIFL